MFALVEQEQKDFERLQPVSSIPTLLLRHNGPRVDAMNNTLYNGLLNEEWFVAYPPRKLKASIAGGTRTWEHSTEKFATPEAFATFTAIAETLGVPVSVMPLPALPASKRICAWPAPRCARCWWPPPRSSGSSMPRS